MKKLLYSFVFLSLLSSCGGDGEKKPADKKETTKNLSDNPVYKEGLALVASPDNDCLTCHKVDERIQGPSYREVANKYKDYPDTIVAYLANKIIKGGNGTWGTIYMTPHAGLSQQDAEKMVRYVLLLKNE
jgi:cytochrome c